MIFISIFILVIAISLSFSTSGNGDDNKEDSVSVSSLISYKVIPSSSIIIILSSSKSSSRSGYSKLSLVYCSNPPMPTPFTFSVLRLPPFRLINNCSNSSSMDIFSFSFLSYSGSGYRYNSIIVFRCSRCLTCFIFRF